MTSSAKVETFRFGVRMAPAWDQSRRWANLRTASLVLVGLLLAGVWSSGVMQGHFASREANDWQTRADAFGKNGIAYRDAAEWLKSNGFRIWPNANGDGITVWRYVEGSDAKDARRSHRLAASRDHRLVAVSAQKFRTLDRTFVRLRRGRPI